MYFPLHVHSVLFILSATIVPDRQILAQQFLYLWSEPDGAGKTLQRISATAYGNDAANWAAAPGPGK
jgi:hypothetical protein